MGIAGMAFHGARGKVGPFVLRKGKKGQTIQSEYKAPSNPRTNKQMAQRIIMSTVAMAAKYMEEIVDHSFEGIARGTDSKAYFKKLNMARLRKLAALDFEEATKGVDSRVFMTTKNVRALIPNSYIVSEGSLGGHKIVVGTQNVQGGTGVGKDFTITLPNFSLTTQSGPEQGVHYVTLGSLLKAIFGLYVAGEQLTFVGIEKSGNNYQYAYQNEPQTPGWMIPYTSMIARRLVVPLNVDFNTLVAVTDNEGVNLASIKAAILGAFTSERTDDILLGWLSQYLDQALTVEYVTGQSLINVSWSSVWNYTQDNADDDDLGYLYALGIIRSRLKDDGSWIYSRCILTMNIPTSDSSTNFGLEWNSAVLAWMESSEVAANEQYLQAGTDQNVIGEDFT